MESVKEDDSNLAIVPCDIGLHILVRLENDEIEAETEILFVGELLGFSEHEMATVKTNLFAGGHRGRVKKYNILVKRLILRSPERFASLTAPYPTHRFLPETDSEDETKEPAYYYAIDGPSVEFWNRVHDTEKMLTRFKVATLWKRREDRISHNDKPEMLHQVDDSLSGVAFRMEHQFAKVLLMQNLHFRNVNKKI